MIERSWYGLYRESWQGEIVDEAFAHPAKFSRALIRRIYQHAIEQGYISAGDMIVDCFGGVGLGALDAMRYGLHWRGVELEPRFVKLGDENIALWNHRYSGAFPAWGTAQLLQGDSRKLATVLQGAEAIISSPPYASSFTNGGGDWGYTEDSRQDIEAKTGSKLGGGQLAAGNSKRYGASPGQLGALSDSGFDAALSSPPYADSVDGSGEGPGARHDYRYHSADNATKASSANGYGSSDGNLGAMGAAISSPPYYDSNDHERPLDSTRAQNGRHNIHLPYGDTAGNLGNDSTDTFWTAARAIVEQVHAVLRPGGVAIWVCGDFVRQGERVHFGRQWLQLCEACGFTPLEWITAWKQEPGPTQLGMFGDDKDHTIDRVSFFRRLANKRNPDAAILNEDVIIVRKATP